MTTPTPRTDALVRKLEAEIRANAKGTPMEDPASQAIDALADCERDLAAALGRAKSAGEDAFKLRVDLAAAQEEIRNYRADKIEMQAQINGAEMRAFQAENSVAAAKEARQRAEARAESNAKDAELGRILMRYIDRLTDPTPADSLELIVGQMSKDVHAAIDAARGQP